MKYACAWCNKHLMEDNDPDIRVSHGICKECSIKVYEKIQNDVNKIIKPRRQDNESHNE